MSSARDEEEEVVRERRNVDWRGERELSTRSRACVFGV